MRLNSDKKVAMALRELYGYEMTPEEVEETRISAIGKLRNELKDLNPPEDDDEFMAWLMKYLR